MTNKTALLTDVTNFKNLAATTDWATLKSVAQGILFKWADVESVSAVSMGGGTFDRQKLAFLETFEGYQLTPRDGSGVPSESNLSTLITSWNDIVEKEALRLAVQGPLKTMFSGLSYDEAKDRIVATTVTGVADALKAAILTLSSTASTAETQWNTNWGPLFNELFDSTDRLDTNSVRTDYAVQSLVKALDGTATALTLSQFVTGLGLTGVQIGTSAANTLTRGDANGLQVYVGDGGNDTINGGYGQDVYVYGRDFGQDTINDVDNGDTGDRIRFAVFNAEDLNFKRVGLDLVIEVKNSTDKITIKNQFETPEVSLGGIQISADKGIEEIQFADGTIYDMGEVAAATGLGTAGNDTLVGTGTADELEGLQGNDLLQGGDNGDTYYYGRGYGADTIQDIMANPLLNAGDALVMLNGLSAKDIQITRVGASDDVTLSIIGSPGDSVTIKDQFMYTPLGYQTAYAIDNRIEAIFFTMGASWSWTDLQAATIETYTTSGIEGFYTNDTMDGGAGNDTLNGGNGSDTYLVGTGTGQDIITETTVLRPETKDVDTLQFGAGITAAQVAFTRSGDDLVLTWNGGADRATITNQFLANGTFGSSWTDIEQFKFADGTTLSAVDAANRVIAALSTAAADTINGSFYAERFDGDAGNDTLNGGGGGDTYVIKTGMGQDTINESVPDFYLNQPDTVEFAAGIARTSVVFSRPTGTNDLVATVGTDSITVKNQFLNSNSKVEFFKFADGSIVAAAQVELFATTAQATSGADTITGTNGDDIIDGGAGNDTIAGGQGNDTFVFGRGSGQDTINDNNSYPGTNSFADKMAFTADVRPSDLVLTRSGNDLVLAIAGTTDQVTIIGQFTTTRQSVDNHDRIETFAFADGTVWSATDIDKSVLLAATTPLADTTVAYDSNDEIQSSQGNDVLQGGRGNDTYYFTRGTGQDTIDDNTQYPGANDSTADALVFSGNITAAYLRYTRVGNDLTVAISGTTDQVMIVGQFTTTKESVDNHDRIETFVFDDGTFLTAAQIDRAVIQNTITAGADVTLGYDSDDSFLASAGNDTLKGGYGNDTYAFGRGAGQDTIDDNDLYPYQTSLSDRVAFGNDVVASDILLSRSGNDLILTISGTTDQLRIVNQFQTTKQSTNNLDRIEYFTFTDGTAWSAADIDKQLILQSSTAGDDTIVGYDSGDELDGGAGNDLLKGAYGKDVYYFGRGDGSDTIDDGDAYEVSSAWSDTVSFKTGLALGDLRFQRSGNDLVIQILGTTDQLRIVNQFQTTKRSTSNYDRIENFVFADGSSQTADQIDILALSQAATTGNDTITR